ncbi:MAG: hypothetical protein QG635_1637, partial [Bacteroidota bacterium]|nr:hypothetical protein [Bacteroidota bacterium]
MRKTILLFLITFLIYPIASHAGTYGVLKGKVIDSEGKPVIGATIRIEGTTRGTFVKEKDGTFSITNISAGQYDIKITAVSYATKIIKDVVISADITTTIDVKLESEVKQTKEIVVIADKIMVQNTAIGQNRSLSSNQIQGVAREGVQSIVGLSAGVFNAGNGFNVRGSRTTETQIRIDGLDASNQFTGGFGLGGLTYYPMMSSFGVEEAQVKTG